MSSEHFIAGGGGGGSHGRYAQLRSDGWLSSAGQSSRQQAGAEAVWVFEELPKATIVSVSRPDASDFTPLLLSYTIQFQYKQFKWHLVKKATQVCYLHFTLKKRAFIEEFHEKQEHVKEWLQNLGIGDHTAVVHDDDEPDDEVGHIHHEDNLSAKNRDVPSRAALPVIRPALGRQQSVSDSAKVAMQGYLNHFLGNMDIVNSREVCKFMEVSRLSFLPEYGLKLKEDYVMVKHLPLIKKDGDTNCCSSSCFSCCNDSWQKVWAVLKPGFLAFLEDPFETKPLDIIVFDVLTPSEGDGDDDGNGEIRSSLAKEVKERNPLRYGFSVSCGDRTITMRVKSNRKVKDWVTAINDAALKPPEGWCHPHRFGSFAPLRGLIEDGSQAQWFVDGQASFDAIASAIEEAKSEIYITDWWLCPELYLRRPFHANGASRLDALLEAKAREGIQVYVLLYKEVPLALKINSFYSQRKLLDIHENIRVLRYPDHFSTGVYLWSHHEKIVIVDHRVCFVGGLDLCFGRYDTREHKVGDFPPLIWPGKDYYNPRESEPNSWEDTMKDELDRVKYPRMPWHDVHCALWGPPCRDVARHFVQRWNHAKRNKAPYEQAIPLLMPQHHMVIPHYMGPEENQENKNPVGRSLGDIKKQDSFSSRLSLLDIPLLLPQDPNGAYLSKENLEQYGPDVNHTNGISFTFGKNKESKDGLSHPDMQMEGFVDDRDVSHLKGSSVTLSADDCDKEWWEFQERGDDVPSFDEVGPVGPRIACCCQVIRSVGHWSAGTSQTEESIHNAYCGLIDRAEHFIYIENQFFISGLAGDEILRNRVLDALFRRILRAEKEKKILKVIIVIPLLPGFQGGIDDGGAASVRAIMHWQYRTISRGPNSILKNLYDLIGSRTHDYISFYGLRAHGKLHDDGPLVTSQVYVHSKIMIVDDRTALIGSANINDRSLLGARDSEIGVLIEDKEFHDSFMGGKIWKAGKFSFSLRISLWSEHLGLNVGEVKQIFDPVIDATYKDIWMATAKAVDSGEEVGRGWCDGRLYYLNLHQPTIHTAHTPSAVLDWHVRLGHPSLNKMKLLLPALHLPSKLLCESCQLSKHSRVSFPKFSTSRSNKLFDLVHSDVWGPLSVPNLGHFKYYILFVDDFSRMSWVYLMKDRSEVFSKFQLFANEVSNQHSSTIKVFRSDNAKEYTSSLFRDYCTSHGIIHETSCAHTPQQNGVSERKHRHLLEVTRSILFSRHVPSSYWPEALLTACYLINRMPSSTLHNKIPFHLVYPNDPLFHVQPQPFGCVCFIHILPSALGKLSARSIKCMFLGYSRTQKGYCCYNPILRKTFVTMDVTFFDQISYYPAPTTPSQLPILPSPSIHPSDSHPPLPLSIFDFPILSTPHNKQFGPLPPPKLADPPIVFSRRPKHLTTTAPTSPDHPPLPADPASSPSMQGNILTSNVNIIAPTSLSVPTGLTSALRHSGWKAAMDVEMQALKDNQTWTLSSLPSGKHLVGCKWVFTIKTNADGSFSRYKARLVAKGYNQTPGIDFTDTFSPVAKLNSVRILISLALQYDWPLFQLDVKNAFLHGDLQDEVYMQQPPGYVAEGESHLVCRLNKPIYGLKQSPRAWFEKFSSIMTNFGFHRCVSDFSIFIKKTSKGLVILLVYVDDIVLTGRC